MIRIPLTIAVALTGPLGLSPAMATDYNTIHLQAKGCPRCEITVNGMAQRWGEWRSVNQTVSLLGGIGTAVIPARFTTLGFLVEDRQRKTGWNSVTTVALLYRGFQPGDRVTKKQSRKSRWAQDCMLITSPETWVSFRVVKDRNPTKWKRRDPTWTKYSLRAWANPQIAGTGLFREAWGGRISTQNPSCGYIP